MRKRLKIAAICLLGLLLLSLRCASPAFAQTPGPGDAGSPDTSVRDNGGDGEDDDRGLLTRLFGIVFPVDSLRAALENAAVMILQGAFSGIGQVYEEALSDVAFGQYVSGPPIDKIRGVWTSVLYVSMALWPVTLALAVLPAARGGIDSSATGYADVKFAVMEWVGSCTAAAMSLFVLNWCMRLAMALAGELFKPGWQTIAKAVAHTFTDSILVGGIASLVPGGSIFLLIFVIILGLTFLVGLFFAFIARYVILYVLMAIAPLVLTLGCMPPTRWLVWLWIKGIVLALLLYPANAIMLRILFEMEASGALLVRLLTVVGILSVVIALNTAVAGAVFSAAAAIAKRAKETTEEIMARILLAVGEAALGVAALGGAGALAGGSGGAVAGGSGGAVAGGSGGAVAGGSGGAVASKADAAMVGGSSGSGGAAAKVRALLSNPDTLERLGRAILMTSRGPIGRAVGILVGDAGALAGDMDRQRQRALRDRYADEHRFLTRQGLDPSDEHFYSIADAMQRLEATYGRDKDGVDLVREHGAPVARTLAAARARGIDLQTLARQAGYSSPGQMFGALTEDSIRGETGFIAGQPHFRLAPLPASSSWQAGVLTAEDWVRGMQVATLIGRAGHVEDITAYAEMVNALRGKGGSEAVDRIVDVARGAHAGALGGPVSYTWSAFAQAADGLASHYGVTYPELAQVELGRLVQRF